MTVWHNVWKYKTFLVGILYSLVEALRASFDLPVDRHSWWYLTLVITFITLLLCTAYGAIAKGKAPT